MKQVSKIILGISLILSVVLFGGCTNKNKVLQAKGSEIETKSETIDESIMTENSIEEKDKIKVEPKKDTKVETSKVDNKETKVDNKETKVNNKETNRVVKKETAKKQEKEQKVDKLNQKENKLETDINKNKQCSVKIYDVNAKNNKFLWSTLEIDDNRSYESKIDFVLNMVHELWFYHAPYKVSMKKYNGKNIAVINLIDKDVNAKNSWSKFFQSSSIGSVNKTRLVDNLLQKQYKGNWVDGVEILYNGSSSANETITKYVPDLLGIKYR